MWHINCKEQHNPLPLFLKASHLLMQIILEYDVLGPFPFLTLCVTCPLRHLSLIACLVCYSPSQLLLKNRFSLLGVSYRKNCVVLIRSQHSDPEVSFYQCPLVKTNKNIVVIFKFVLQRSSTLSTHSHGSKVIDTCIIVKNNQTNKYLNNKRQAPYSLLLPHPNTKWPKTFQMPFDKTDFTGYYESSVTS